VRNCTGAENIETKECIVEMSDSSEFLTLVRFGKDPAGVAVLLILAWIAACDNDLDNQELKELETIADASPSNIDLSLLLNLVKNRDLASIQLACEIIKHNFENEKSDLFLEMAIQMAIADRYLLTSENHILRFIADLVGISNTKLKSIFIEVTGKPLPDLTDASNTSYWNRDKKSSHTKSQNSNLNSKIVDAFSILGLNENASKTEIKAAYRR
jgi:DnaJ-domain-containing protein 1